MKHRLGRFARRLGWLFAWLSWFGANAQAINVQTFSGRANTRFVLNENGRSELGAGNIFLSATYNFLNDPLVMLSEDRQRRLATVLDGMHTFNLVAGYAPSSAWSLNLDFPVAWVKVPGGSYQSALGDLRIFSKVFVLQSGDCGLSLVPELDLPTGSRSFFLSDDQVGWGLLAALERRFGRLSVAINAGFRSNANASYLGLDLRQRIPLGASLLYEITDRWGVNLEGLLQLTLPYRHYVNPAEVYAGARWKFAENGVAIAGAGLGSTNRSPSDDYRLVLGLRLIIDPPHEAPVVHSQAAPIVVPRTLERDIRFEHDSARLTRGAHRELEEVARLIIAHPDQFPYVKVEGHTNELGSDHYNLALSKRRAKAVYDDLLRHGVPATMLEQVGYGESLPKVGPDEAPLEERLVVNRRVEFKIIHDKTLSFRR